LCVAILIYVNYAHIYFPVWQLGVVITFYGSLFVTLRFAIVRSQSSIPKDIKQSNVVTAVQFSSMLGNKFLKYRYHEYYNIDQYRYEYDDYFRNVVISITLSINIGKISIMKSFISERVYYSIDNILFDKYSDIGIRITLSINVGKMSITKNSSISVYIWTYCNIDKYHCMISMTISVQVLQNRSISVWVYYVYNIIQLLHFIECDMMCYGALKSNIVQGWSFYLPAKSAKYCCLIITSVSISTNKAILVYTRKLDLKQYLANMFIIISGRRVSHCVVCSSSIYGFWLPLWYPQTLL
jgi:hypothetical protein